MVKVDSLDYPTIRSWETKIFAMPNIPRAEKGFPESLMYILMSIKDNTPISSTVEIPGSQSERNLEQLYINLRPSGIVNKPSTGWEISQIAQKWLETEDSLYLAAILNANIKFFSEIIHLIKNGYQQTREIQEIANNNYNLNWKTKSEIRTRINWLRDLNLIWFENFSRNHYLTDQGEKFLSTVGYLKPEEIKTYKDATLEEIDVPMSSWAWKMSILDDETKSSRKTGLGYIPGSMQNTHNTIVGYLRMMSTPTEFSTITEYSLVTYGVAESSTRAFITTLMNLGFIQRETKTHYKTSELGGKFPTDNFEMDFACCMNSQFSFFFEILFELKEEHLTAKELAVTAKVSHGFPSENRTEINKRLHILKNAKLIQEAGVSKYSLTHRGELFIEKLQPHYQVNDEGIDKQGLEESDINGTEVEDLLEEIRHSSVDSSNPSRFEEAVKEAFSLLGFKADLLGGAGKTDVLIEAPTTPKFSYTVAVDAKSAYNGRVTEDQINFDTLAEHKTKHKANYSVVVGREFQGKRLTNRAIKNEVVLINVEELELLIKMHTEVPLKSDSYQKLFAQKGFVNPQVIEEDRNNIRREGQLLQAIMKCLFEESNDPHTEGIMQPKEIYILLKSQNLFTPIPTLGEIKQMLEFLSSPLIGCVGSVKEGYYALGSLTDAAHKFSFYLKACID
ncbi:hypothetical protein GCM10007063_34430 [Lentibacillus kapialis]|uniref:Restriction endonuclease type IV Mrr domain-containing protein n=1 Tax=Lentibacillus kapialis TaxID=340214 RepID=A0A917Q301_9BACI|nr:restriction endonuclease [Lentibacillus kapialis]GGK09118.1 hypothetical protein GCM10007063_34430 [Lentibacillus kapialis]